MFPFPSNCHKCKISFTLLNCSNKIRPNTNETYCCKCWRHQQENGQNVDVCDICRTSNLIEITSNDDVNSFSSMCLLGSDEAIQIATALSLSEFEESKRKIDESAQGSCSYPGLGRCFSCKKQTDDLWKIKSCKHIICRKCLLKGICNMCHNLIEDAYKLQN